MAITNQNNHSAKVLLVEDEPSLIAMYQAAFKSSPYTILVAPDAKNGFELALKHKPILVLLDIILPQEEGTVVEFNKRVGIDLLRRLKKESATKAIPILMLTNLDSPDDRKQAEKLGAEQYIIKANFLPRQIVKLVEKYVNT